jgi:ubiquinone/menaquinone biosynthesis C-methylase UbiE
MTPDKLDKEQYEQYWQDVHINENNDLAAVCFPDKPRYFNRFFDQMQKWVIAAYLRKQQVRLKNQRLLDIGCGRGRWLSMFHEQYGADVTGIDLSPTAVEVCRWHGFDACVGSVAELPFAAHSFDVLTSITVLLHIPYNLKQAAIIEIARVLKPGGSTLLIESTFTNPKFASPHVFNLPLDEWQALFNNAGMQNIHRSGHYFNLARLNIPTWFPYQERVAIYADYLLESILNRRYYGKSTNLGLQHFMVFQKL